VAAGYQFQRPAAAAGALSTKTSTKGQQGRTTVKYMHHKQRIRWRETRRG